MKYQNGQRLPLESGGYLRLSVNPRARRLSIRIDIRADEAVAVAPSQRHLAQAVAFAQSRRDWIAERLARRIDAVPLVPNGQVGWLGRSVRLEATGGAGAACLVETPQGPVIRAGGEGEAFSRRIETWLKRSAKEFLGRRTHVHLNRLGLEPVRLSIVDTRSRWGSCSPHNRSIRYSWRIIMAPEAVADYLAAHEVAHLVHADHSPAYWAVVDQLVGDHRPFRQWLREHGAALHAVGRA